MLLRQLGARIAQVALDHGERLLPHRHNPLLIALAYAANAADFRIEVRRSQMDQLGNAQARRIQHLEHGSVAQAERRLVVRLLQQAINVLQAQIAGERPPDFGRFEVQGRIALDHLLNLEEAKEVAQRDQVARHGFAFQVLPVKAREKLHKRVAINAVQFQLAPAHKSFEFAQIAPVRRNGIRREALFDSRVIQERRDRCRYIHLRFLVPFSAGPAAQRNTINLFQFMTMENPRQPQVQDRGAANQSRKDAQLHQETRVNRERGVVSTEPTSHAHDSRADQDLPERLEYLDGAHPPESDPEDGK